MSTWYTILPWDKIEIVVEVQEDYFKETGEQK